MYLEERVEQLEVLSVDHGRQVETIAKGLVDLTITVNQRFDQVNQRFEQIDQRFDQVEQRLDRVEQRLDRVEADIAVLKTDVAELKLGQARLEAAVADIQQTQKLILSILQNRLQ